MALAVPEVRRWFPLASASFQGCIRSVSLSDHYTTLVMVIRVKVITFYPR